MKRLFLLALLLSSFTMWSAKDQNIKDYPITYFPYGEYLANGHYHKDTGEEGDYPSYVVLSGSEMDVYHVLNDVAMSFKFNFNFEYTGFFTVDLSYTDPYGQDQNYEGNGYCMSTQCHYYIKLGDIGFIEENISLNADGIIKVGSLHLNTQDDDGNPIVEKIAWEENLFLISDRSADDDFEE